jgi:hypothetical protein
MFIIVDSNELATSPDTIDRLKHTFPGLIVGKLDYGDINVILDDGTILAIERKQIFDFLGSIGDGRLFDQAERMAKAKYSAIIVQGTLGYTADDMAVANKEKTNWHGASVRGAMYAVQYSGCPVIFCQEDWYPKIVEGLIEFVSKPDQHWQRKYRRIITFPPLDDRVEILASMPVNITERARYTVGVKRATSLVEFANKKGSISLAETLSWGTCLNLINKEDRPEGWGTKVIEQFRQYLGLKENQYLEVKESKTDGN